MRSRRSPLSRIGFVASLLLACASVASAVTFNYSSACVVPTTIGPVTFNNVATSGSVDLTTGVPSTAAILSSSLTYTINSNNLTSGTFTGALACTLTFGGVSVNYAQPLTDTIVPAFTPGCTATSYPFAQGCIVFAPVSVSVNLGALGTVVVSAPGRTVKGYDGNIAPGTIVIGPASAIDTATLTTTAPPATPLPPSLVLTAIGAAGLGLNEIRRRRRQRKKHGAARIGC